ncbi:hypothetical protein I79_026072 [Cricetulus griseus]|uniref:Uncharacterized protein n=1 Tax=Cricetulus griseus TaxID=10029 RepID=G3IPY7_CRIGR|nr:hypothetical protein I79_026072 [Cricetulus griseus]
MAFRNVFTCTSNIVKVVALGIIFLFFPLSVKYSIKLNTVSKSSERLDGVTV